MKFRPFLGAPMPLTRPNPPEPPGMAGVAMRPAFFRVGVRRGGREGRGPFVFSPFFFLFFFSLSLDVLACKLWSSAQGVTLRAASEDLSITYFRISKRWDRFLANLLGETLVQ